MDQKKEKQVRKCIVTGENMNKADMLRIVSFQGGPISFDLTGKANGRGCYVSLKEENLEKLLDRGGAVLARTFRRKISKEELEYVKTEFPKFLAEKQFRPKQTKPIVVKISKEDYLKSKSVT